MAEYINRTELIENLKKQYGEDLGWQCTVNMSDIGMMIEDTPTADVVEIEMLRDWLWKIALNSVGCDFVGDFSIACQDIISRLDELKRFAEERRADNDV